MSNSRKDDIKALADKLAKVVEYDRESHTVKLPEKAYQDNLPDGLSIKTVKAVQNYSKDYIDASAAVLQQEASKVFKEDSSVEQVRLEAPIGAFKKDSLEGVVDRRVEVTNPRTGEKQHKPRLRMHVTMTGTKGTKSYIKDLANELQELIKD